LQVTTPTISKFTDFAYINCTNITRCLPEKNIFLPNLGGGTAPCPLASYAYDRNSLDGVR